MAIKDKKRFLMRYLDGKYLLSELNPFDVIEFLEYLNKRDININLFDRRGYDIISKKFFVNEVREYSVNSYSINFGIKFFNTFDEYYDYLNGDVYNHACYYGYLFDIDYIKKYSIDINKLNFISFTNKQIEHFSLKCEEKKQEQLEIKNRERNRIIKEWITINDTIETFDSLKAEISYLRKKGIKNDDIIFHYLLKKYGNKINKYILDYIMSKPIDINSYFLDFLLNNLNKKEAETENERLIATHYGYYNRQKLYKKNKKIINLFFNEKTSAIKQGYYDSNNRLFKIQFVFYCDSNIPFYKLIKYYDSFEMFVKELGGDLSNVDLSESDIDINEIKKYITNNKTKFPIEKGSLKYLIIKEFKNNKYYVTQKIVDSSSNIVRIEKNEFQWFCDFVYFLKNDISNADLLFCEGIENIKNIKNIKKENIKVNSRVAKELGLEINGLSNEMTSLAIPNLQRKNEVETANSFLEKKQEFNEYDRMISYISDIHLPHKYMLYDCKSIDDVEYVNTIIANKINADECSIKLICGDISSDFSQYKFFLNKLKEKCRYSKYFITLGNHELWPFSGVPLNNIIGEYKKLYNNENLFLVQNNLFYFEKNDIKEITTEELTKITKYELRRRLQAAQLIIFGGIGFSGCNETFNADIGIYKETINRESEINQSDIFRNLYLKVVESLNDKNVIILTHMPMNDWNKFDRPIDRFVYVSGHNHRNYFYDDGLTRIYADNQSGYTLKNIEMKHFYVSVSYDLFSDYDDGIYSINRRDYELFYKGIGESISFTRDFKNIYMIKKSYVYMFFLESNNGTLSILNGGSIRKTNGHSLEYYYDNLVNYSNAINLFLNKYNKKQFEMSEFVKSIGGSGRIHGCIIDIDFYNHIYINPLDGTVVPYFAFSIIDKYVYNNISSLLFYRSPELYENLSNNYNNNLLTVINDGEISNKLINVLDTKMYSISRIIKGLQYTCKYNIVRVWNDKMIENQSDDLAKLLIEDILKISK